MELNILEIFSWLNCQCEYENEEGNYEYFRKILCSIKFNKNIKKIKLKKITLYNKTTNDEYIVDLTDIAS